MRHRSRQVHKTAADWLESRLGTLGWTADPVIFGATAVTFLTSTPQLAGGRVEPNTVAFTIDFQAPTVEAEIGGGMYRTRWQLFVDVFGESESITRALCDDIIAELSNLRLPVTDYSVDPPVVSSEMIEIDSDLSVDEPPAAGQVETTFWRVITGPVDVFHGAD